ncbi:MAG TPA: xanthine dehydrogenase family protein molybdopterin-binding subunit [Pseudonocardia sp.]|uniref:xanthine dehydrogenase family protein molybdopterin-binding subunit n=1 Tax=Pseudonocardia sp. TaxID=60912 RepID=UPI002B4B20BD|nr:xanthine dehydrogenase family protein molybdopterin-binding subunit [Pseudonocardia sp.]HLU58936.1 xanthine dehydrogenase family protein molybdopterin-binding subunit [Pseudonocardia sp.]
MPEVGSDRRMHDAEERVVGTVPFVLDVRVDGMAHAKAVRSPFPHARIRSVRTDDALAVPGVLLVLTGADLDADPEVNPYYGSPRPDQPALAIGKARYAGEPVAVVVAETAAAAAAAAPLVEVDYEELPHVVDANEAARPGAPVVHDAWPDNGCGSWRVRHGDPDAALASADRVYTGVYHSPSASHVPMEPMVCIADWTGGGLEVWSATQAPHAVREALEKMFAVPPGGVRVRTLNVGGGYGAKTQVKIEPLVACAARAAGRPVRMELARDEVFLTAAKHAATVELTTGVRDDGTIVARRVKVNYNAGAYALSSPIASGQGLTRANGPYTIPNVAIESVATYTNTVPSCPFRGAMTSQLAFAYESQLDDIAADLGMDPLELRRKNLLRDGEVYPTGEVMHDLHYDELLDDLERAIDWGGPPEPAPPGKARGKGIAIMLKNTLTPTRSEARLRLVPDGRVHLDSSTVELGQGSHPTLLQLTADHLGISADRLVRGFPDTAHTPYDTTTSSSRSTHAMGTALERAAADLKRRLRALAADHWGVPAEEVEVADGHVAHPGTGERLPWEGLLAATGTGEVVGEGVFAPDFGLTLLEDPHDVRGRVTVHWHQGGAAAEVEVDLETGRVEVLRMHANCYAGRVVSPLRVRQQNQGCAVFGLGPTLFEELHYQDGTLTNPNLSDYMIPSILDVPAVITSSALEAGDESAELHGVGEMALPAVAPAVANALFAATGTRIDRLPLTPERVLRALGEHDPVKEETG